MNKYLGPSSRFGDGDGSFWDRWLTTTGHFSEQGKYANADMPTHSMYSKGSVRGYQCSYFVLFLVDKAGAGDEWLAARLPVAYTAHTLCCISE